MAYTVDNNKKTADELLQENIALKKENFVLKTANEQLKNERNQYKDAYERYSSFFLIKFAKKLTGRE